MSFLIFLFLCNLSVYLSGGQFLITVIFRCSVFVKSLFRLFCLGCGTFFSKSEAMLCIKFPQYRCQIFIAIQEHKLHIAYPYYIRIVLSMINVEVIMLSFCYKVWWLIWYNLLMHNNTIFLGHKSTYARNSYLYTYYMRNTAYNTIYLNNVFWGGGFIFTSVYVILFPSGGLLCFHKLTRDFKELQYGHWVRLMPCFSSCCCDLG